MSDDIYVCKESSIVDIDGVPTGIFKDVTRVRAGHELLARYPELFAPITVHYDVTEDTSARQRDTGRSSAVKAASRK